MNVNMNETTHTPSSCRKTTIEELVNNSFVSQKVILSSPDSSLETTLDFDSNTSVSKQSIRQNEIPYFGDLSSSVFGYTVMTPNGKKMYLSPSELEDGSEEVDFHSPLVSILHVGEGEVTYQSLLALENDQLRSVLGKKDRENKNLVKQSSKFKRMATRDDLTGCLNSNSYIADQRQHVTNAIEKGTSMFYVMVDLKNLKILNDIYGKKVGDEALEKLGSVMRELFQREHRDFVYRIGGDEFGIMVYDSNQEGFENRLKLLETVLGTQRIKNPHYVDGKFDEQDKYLRIVADVGYARVDFEDLSVVDMRGQQTEWYRERFTEYAETPADALMKVNKLGSEDPNMSTHRHTAQYKLGSSSPVRVENRMDTFFRKEVLTIQVVQ